jgi:dihydroorotase-like cyclic amidohydrolase
MLLLAISLQFDLRQKMMHTNDLIRSVSGTDEFETFVSSCWTWCRQHGKSPVELAEMISRDPARLLGLSGSKGVLRVGAQADFCVLNG